MTDELCYYCGEKAETVIFGTAVCADCAVKMFNYRELPDKTNSTQAP
jgi:NMD protein affecting ribosome stability and mRNA decay